MQHITARFGDLRAWAFLVSWFLIAVLVNSNGVSWWLAFVIAATEAVSAAA
jgi:hypothetical protein